jgi:uncharacterized protein (DUF849 family)
MKEPRKSVQAKLLAAAGGVETDVSLPSRARASSFTSTLVDLKVGQDPAAKVVRLEPDVNMEALADVLAAEKERLRNNVTSSISAAKRRVENSQYSIECTHFICNSGIYVAALVTRTE